jgi:phosphate-selective porin OprO and OprP
MRLALLFLLLTSFELITAQDFTDNKFGKGIRITAKDSSFSMKLGARFQTLYEGIYNEDSEEWSDKLLIRRARLKFEGFAYSPKLEYKIEIGLSNRDIGGATPETGNTPRIILDAVLKWHFKDNWQLWFGQTKLPGNRERVISSQKLQFVDRSLVNSRFNLDRDIGIQLHHKNKFGGGILKQYASISMGEGRNITSDNIGGYDYTGRLEYLPFGEFKSQGDYFGSDLKREEKPKLAIGATYDFNQGASRQRGQLGGFNSDAQGSVTNDLSTFFIDAMFKYNGLSIMSEYAHRAARKDIAGFEFGTGNGYVLQTGYLFKNNFEIAARYTIINSDDLIFSSINEETEYTWGISKYIVEHSLKIQSDLSYGDRENASNTIRYRFQVELSF